MTHPDAPTTTRRQFLRSASLAAGGLVLAGSGRAGAQSRVTRRFVLPSVDRFEGNYEGQFVVVDEQVDESAGDVPIEGCDFGDTWPAEQTQAYNGQLLDRLGESPVAVDLRLYADGSKESIEPDSTFVVQNSLFCPEDYVGLEGEWITREAVQGKPPGPTVTPGGGTPTPTDTNVPGFGVLAALAGAGGAFALRALGRRRDGES